MAKKKLTTQEILALARQQDAGSQDSASASVESELPPAEVAVDEPAAAKATPKSTADILAAARGKGGGAGKPAAKATPKSTADILAAARGKGGAAKKSGTDGGAKEISREPLPSEVAAADSGEKLSVQEMLRAVRGGDSAVVKTAAPVKPVIPVRPAKPKPVMKKPGTKKDDASRRNFLLMLIMMPFALALSALGLSAGVGLLGLARFMMPNTRLEPPSKFKIGPPGDYPFGTVTTKWKAEFNVWITHTNYKGLPMIYALSTVCTHLGCTPNWLESDQKFKCPCHGSGFYSDGVNFEGPAPRPLERYGIRVAADGMLEIDKSVKFQEEMGQWADAASFVSTV